MLISRKTRTLDFQLQHKTRLEYIFCARKTNINNQVIYFCVNVYVYSTSEEQKAEDRK